MNRIRSIIYCATYTALVAIGYFIGVDSAVAQDAYDN
jgi:hypothetical protein